ncbi:hypothetical protein [Anaerophaga thermohalophila]|uniref:hypothetical protein n=1 Tax=Anaerophaga thermohalophila TaxID=177400 RepID=UPI000237D199|nr:hypothetical protein [Anaerophaga thermohalophila]
MYNSVFRSSADIDELKVPNPETDGLLPIMLSRLMMCRPGVEEAGHRIRFSVSRFSQVTKCSPSSQK